MKRLIIIGMASALFHGSYVLAQSSDRSEALMGRNNSGPPMATLGAAIDEGADFVELRKRSPGDLKAMAADHRKAAEALATAVRSGANIPSTAKDRIRRALAQDITAWRAEFRLSLQEWQAMRDHWLTDRGNTTASQWVMRRADWFTARDAWIAKHKT